MATVAKSKVTGFSTKCPIDVAIKTMNEGMDLAIMLSQFTQKGGHDGLGMRLKDEL